jgi:hypothetical protein
MDFTDFSNPEHTQMGFSLKAGNRCSLLEGNLIRVSYGTRKQLILKNYRLAKSILGHGQ